MWEARVISSKDGEKSTIEQYIDLHKCTDDEFKSPEMGGKFHEPASKDRVKIKSLIRKRAMWCLNDLDREGRKINKNLFGPDDGKPHRRIDLIFKPCTPIHPNDAKKNLDGTFKDNCVWDKTNEQTVIEKKK
jgi:hypothetical protein